MSKQELAKMLAWAYKQGYQDATEVLAASVTAVDETAVSARLLAALETLPSHNATKSEESSR